MKTIVFCNARNEHAILEWAVHQVNLGFTTVYIIDHKSDTPIAKQLFPDNVIVIRSEEDIPKVDRMMSAAKQALDNSYDFMTYLDADEQIVLNKFETINEFLSHFDSSVGQIGLNWVCFGSNFHNSTPEGYLIENYLQSDVSLDQHIKVLVRPNAIDLKRPCPNPHVFYVKPGLNSISVVDGALLNSHEPWFYRSSANFGDISAFVAHYIYQSWDSYLSRKVHLPRDDSFQKRHVLDKDLFHKLHNYQKNTNVYDKYYKKNQDLLLQQSGKQVFFDPVFYANKYSDLKDVFGLDETKLWNHQSLFGKKEQRVCFLVDDEKPQ